MFAQTPTVVWQCRRLAVASSYSHQTAVRDTTASNLCVGLPNVHLLISQSGWMKGVSAVEDAASSDRPLALISLRRSQPESCPIRHDHQHVSARCSRSLLPVLFCVQSSWVKQQNHGRHVIAPHDCRDACEFKEIKDLRYSSTGTICGRTQAI